MDDQYAATTPLPLPQLSNFQFMPTLTMNSSSLIGAHVDIASVGAGHDQPRRVD